jgi:tryprostatin B 6-hydroxylase
MPQYEESMVTHTRQLDNLIQKAVARGESVDFTTLAYWYAFDNMGAFTLSKSFNMLRDNQWHDAVSNLKSSLPLMGSLGQAPWLVRIALTYLGYFGIMKSWHAMTDWCWEQLKERMDVSDMSTWSGRNYKRFQPHDHTKKCLLLTRLRMVAIVLHHTLLPIR